MYFLLKIRVYLCIALSVCLLGIEVEARANDHYEIVTNPGVREKALSVNSLRSIFSMHLKTWPDGTKIRVCLLYTSPSPRDRTRSRMPSSA